MRYTAKARMLSFDFLADDVVYHLPHVQALLLAGMITRADNLGRLPGDPPVLLAYLFFPKPPRHDITEAEVTKLLFALATVAPPVIVWYQVERSRYAQFMRWKVHQAGLRAHNLKSTLPGPDAPGAQLVVEAGQPSLFALPPPPEVELLEDHTADIEKLVRGVGAQAALARTLGDFDESCVWEWVRADGSRISTAGTFDGPGWVKFAHWLWNTGTHDMATVVALLDECYRLRPKQPYAYFHPEHGTRDIKAMQATAAEVVERHEQTQKEDRERWGREPH